jgi:two-component system, OmpR family, sensor kinase
MGKFFISLYVFITLALVGLSAGLETLFFNTESVPKASVLRQVLSASKQQNIDVLALIKQTSIPFQVLNINDMAWSENSLNKLQSGDALSLYDANLGEQIYLLLDSHRILEISLMDPLPNQTSFILYRTVFFILLGGLIALWIWPLWRDLEALKKSVTTVLPDGNISQNQVSKSSLVAPIAVSLNSMRIQIANLIQSQRELSGAVAHEFRTPLARLKFALGMLDDSQDEMFTNMRKDVLELEKLVQEMLDFSATEAQMPNLHFCEIPLTSICHNLVDKLRQSHLQNLNVNVYGGEEQLMGDGHFVERAIENLLLNASRYATSCINIKVEVLKDVIQVSVEDDGKGVKQELCDKIFEPFYRPDEARDRTQGGAGLGLAIVKRVMQWHRGTCKVSQSTMGGAKFSLLFPHNP